MRLFYMLIVAIFIPLELQSSMCSKEEAETYRQRGLRNSGHKIISSFPRDPL